MTTLTDGGGSEAPTGRQAEGHLSVHYSGAYRSPANSSSTHGSPYAVPTSQACVAQHLFSLWLRDSQGDKRRVPIRSTSIAPHGVLKLPKKIEVAAGTKSRATGYFFIGPG
jgi:hypothetical protein